MKKRKILALILACATILALVGCGNNATTDNSEKDTTGNTTVESESEVGVLTLMHGNHLLSILMV